MLSLKLRRIGKKGQASFRIVAAEARSKNKSKCVEDIGWVNPHTDKFEINGERAKYWIGCGAQPTETVADYLKKVGIENKAK
jgi:small subunit ribosomal protein S16